VRGRTALTVLGVVIGATALSVLGMRADASAPPGAASAPAASGVTADPSASGSAADPPADGSRAAPDPTSIPLRETSERVVAYTLSAELMPDTHTVRGTGTLVWRNTSRVAATKVHVHLYLNAFKNGRTVFWRTPMSDFRGDPMDGPGHIDVERFFARELGQDLWPKDPTTPGDPEDATDIEVPLPRPIEPGESLTIDMAWTSHLPTVTIRTGYSGTFHMVAQWFPKIARLEPNGTWAHFPFHRLSEFYADFGTYDVTVTAPEAFTIGAVGTLVSQGPAAPAQGAEASPPRTTRRFTAADVHDFAFTAWDRFRSLEETTEDGVKVTCLFPEGYDAAARAEIAAVKFGLGYLGAAYGRYPYTTLTIVHPPSAANEAGGMEYPTLITTGGSWRRSGLLETHELEILTLHELAHQWFYGIVASNEHEHPFLDEGLTSYAETDACEAFWPDASAGRGFGLQIGLPALHRAGALEATGHAPVSTPARAFVSGADYGGLVYSRTAAALRTLGNVYGEDALRRAIGLYARRHRFGHPTPEDLFAAIRDGLGAGAEGALRTALTEPSTVDLIAEVAHSEPRTDGKFGQIGYALVRRRGTIRLPVDVLLIAEDGTTRRVRWDAAEISQRIPYEGDSPLVAAVVDPEHRVLLDEDLTNNAVSVSGGRFAWRTLEGTSFLGGLLARGLLP
jgi:Peptidase family M1 domain